MSNLVWYNLGVPQKFEKKDTPITMKVADSLRHTLEEIGEKEDRPLGYIARELMIRGLALYRTDGKLRNSERKEQPWRLHLRDVYA